jgi:hypothetical protein
VVLRGGAWNNNEDNARCAYRNRNNADNRNNNVGFRLAESFCPASSRGSEMRRVMSATRAAAIPGRTTGPLPTEHFSLLVKVSVE